MDRRVDGLDGVCVRERDLLIHQFLADNITTLVGQIGCHSTPEANPIQ